ncbi:hypothetical protein Hamer_G031677 [Homarus americanus]|uniref:Uncharacterized protein n=1 Tax=Homarus americanus TaxID=6706 RepID=A0A8J5K363_HOMAM|nr:hypothetical protein Hamer_G031677 [Homarus americanus]
MESSLQTRSIQLQWEAAYNHVVPAAPRRKGTCGPYYTSGKTPKPCGPPTTPVGWLTTMWSLTTPVERLSMGPPYNTSEAAYNHVVPLQRQWGGTTNHVLPSKQGGVYKSAPYNTQGRRPTKCGPPQHQWGGGLQQCGPPQQQWEAAYNHVVPYSNSSGEAAYSHVVPLQHQWGGGQQPTPHNISGMRPTTMWSLHHQWRQPTTTWSPPTPAWAAQHNHVVANTRRRPTNHVGLTHQRDAAYNHVIPYNTSGVAGYKHVVPLQHKWEVAFQPCGPHTTRGGGLQPCGPHTNISGDPPLQLRVLLTTPVGSAAQQLFGPPQH